MPYDLIVEDEAKTVIDSHKDSDLSPKTEDALRLLDSEIRNVRDAETRHGWTSWGLVGAIIGSLWLLSEELKTGNLRFAIIATAVLIFSTLIDSLRWLSQLLWQAVTPRDEPVRFRWSNEFFAGNELLFVVEILRSLGLLALAFVFAPRWWFALSAVSIAYVWYLTMATLWLILTRMESPVRQGWTKSGVAFILAFIIPCVIAFISYLRLAPLPVGDVVGSFRVGGLLVVVTYIILLLTIITKESPVLRSLIAIRRNIVFKRMEINSALKQAEIALSGMQVPDAIQRDVHPILRLVERLNEATTNLLYQVQTMRTHLPRLDDSKDVISAKSDILISHRNTCEFILRDRDATLKELTSRFQQLMKRRQRIQGVIPEASDFFNQLDDGMKTILDEADRKFADYIEQANDYTKQLEKNKALSDRNT